MVSKKRKVETTKIDGYLIKTSGGLKGNLDGLWAEAFYACNIPFSVIDHPRFRAAMESTRPGYQLPTRKQLAGKHLDDAFEKVDTQLKSALTGKRVTVIQDGWSDVHNHPIIATSVHTGNKSYFLCSENTGSNRKTAEYCAEKAQEAIRKVEQQYGAIVVGFCSDNEAKMVKMRQLLMETNPTLHAYGCAAHYMNLLGNDITVSAIINNVVEISKYFRNHHVPAALLQDVPGSIKPILPASTRWNSQLDCIRAYITNRPALLVVCNGDNDIDPRIVKLVNDCNLLKQAKDHVTQLTCVASALDQLQSDSCSVADACELLLSLGENENLQPYKVRVEKRINACLRPVHYLANMIHPTYRGARLSPTHRSVARELLTKLDSEMLPFPSLLKCKESPFEDFMFSGSFSKLKPVQWYKCVAVESDNVDLKRFVTLAQSILVLPSSSAGIERIFSNFSVIHSDLRNRLEPEKVAKLVACYRALRDNTDSSSY